MVDKLRELKEMHEQGLITAEEYEATKAKAIEEMLGPENGTTQESTPHNKSIPYAGNTMAFWGQMSDADKEKHLKQNIKNIKVYRTMLIVFSILFGLSALFLIILFSVTDTWDSVTFWDVFTSLFMVVMFLGFCYFQILFSKQKVERIESSQNQNQ